MPGRLQLPDPDWDPDEPAWPAEGIYLGDPEDEGMWYPDWDPNN